MARRRSRKNQGLLEIAVCSDWQYAASLAGGSLFVGVILVPAFFGKSPVLLPLGSMITTLSWLVSAVFAAIAVVRYLKQRPASPPGAMPLQRVAIPPRLVPAVRPSSGPRIESADPAHIWPASMYAAASTSPQRPEAWSLDVLDRMEWKRFEDLCCAFYLEKGIRAEVTHLGADGGVDVRLFQDDTDPARLTAIVQCKAWNQQVGVKPVRELRGVMAHEKVEKAFFMAPQGFTDDARAFAAENRVTLLDGKLFLAMLQRLPAESSRRLLDLATEGDWTTPTCPSCGTKMMARDSRRGRFWGCTSYPKCRGKLPMRSPRKPPAAVPA